MPSSSASNGGSTEMPRALSEIAARLKRVEHPAVRIALLRTASVPHLARRGHVVRRRRIEKYLASTAEPKLQVGAGPLTRDGWLNSDLISGDVYLDLTRRLPLPDSSFAYVFGEHVIEHVSEQQGIVLMGELRRILRPGGVLRLVTPDLEKIVALYRDENPVISRADYIAYLDEITGKRHERSAQMFNDYLRLWGHRYLYDCPDLMAKLSAAGFVSVRRVEPGESDHRPLRGLERHGGAAWVNRAEAVCMEATRA